MLRAEVCYRMRLTSVVAMYFVRCFGDVLANPAAKSTATKYIRFLTHESDAVAGSW